MHRVLHSQLLDLLLRLLERHERDAWRVLADHLLTVVRRRQLGNAVHIHLGLALFLDFSWVCQFPFASK